MLLGIGIDIVEIIDRFKVDPISSFINNCFNDAEVAYARSQVSGDPSQHLAAHYAVKEAAIKALDQARGDKFLRVSSINYCGIEVDHDREGRPCIKFHGEFEKLVKSMGVKQTLVSISHDKGYAIAVVALQN